DDQKLEALTLINENVAFRQVSLRLHIPLGTLARWRRNPRIILGTGNNTALNVHEEQLLVEALNYTLKCGFPQTRDDLKDMVQSYVIAKGKNPFTNGRPGDDWALNFERRHKDTLRRKNREPLSYKRAEGLTRENVDNFYTLLKQVLDEHNLWDKPWCIANCDETGMSADCVNVKVYVPAGRRHAYGLQPDATKTSYSVLFCFNAIGQMYPPYVVYKASNLYTTWALGGPAGAGFNISESGWMVNSVFEAWFENIYLPKSHEHAQGNHRLLIFDGHNSHLTFRTIELAMENNVTILCLPPNTSHALQPLDVSVFRSLKAIYSSVCREHFSSGRRVKSVNKELFPSLLKKVCDKLCADESLARNGFRKSGIMPFNHLAVEEKIVEDITGVVPPSTFASGSPLRRRAGRPRRRTGNPQPVGRPPALHISPKRPPRSEIRLLRQNISNSVSKKIVSVDPPKPPRKRTRMQAKGGEIITTEVAAERFRKEEEERNRKKALADAKAGRKNSAKAKPAAGVSISFKPVTKGATASKTGTLQAKKQTPIDIFLTPRREPYSQYEN
ncbi:unnamed protein product, partial [Meganyctiphanes norvegica]